MTCGVKYVLILTHAAQLDLFGRTRSAPWVLGSMDVLPARFPVTVSTACVLLINNAEEIVPNPTMAQQEVNGENIVENTINDSIISEVKLRTPIWDMRDKSYKDQISKKKIWEEIAFNLKMDETFVKTRWRSLRDRYLREVKKAKPTSGQGAVTQTSWPFYLTMAFLSGVVEPRQTTTSMTPAQSFSYSNAGLILADLELGSINDNQALAANCRVLATQNDSNNSVELLSPASSVDSQDLSQPSSSDHSGLPDQRCQTKCSGKRSAPSQSKPSKTKKTDQDPIDVAILDLVRSRQDASSKPELTSEEHFYLSIAKDVADFDFITRMRLRQAVLDTIMKELARRGAELDPTD